jgi:MFS family permease
MLLSFALMGVGILGLALTPGYATIGVAAPVLAIFFRLVQGFALGGNIGPSTAYMIEAAPLERRGIYSSMQYVTQDLAGLAAAIVGVLLASVLSPLQLQVWGWRVAMLIGAAIVPFGLMLRQTLPETLPGVDDRPRETVRPAPRTERLRPHARIIVLGLLILTSTTIGAYVVSYMTTYAIATLHMADRLAFGVSIVTSLCSITFEASSGWLSDRFGRKPVMLVPGFVLLVSILPAFMLITHFQNVAALYGAMAWLVPLAALSYTPAITLITESLPMAIRSGVGATIYALAISIFGGSTQFVITWLIDAMHNPIAPAYYWTAASVLGLTAMALARESAPVKAAAAATSVAEAGV